ncbi:MAG: hypothetical protein ACRD6W_13480 [Nitrososphaerales archaeon]
MARRSKVNVVAQGRRYRLGSTPEYGGIWQKRPWGWRLVSRYPLTDEGWHVARQQFDSFEPPAPAAVPGSAPVLPVRHFWSPRWGWAAIPVVLSLVIGGSLYLTSKPTGNSELGLNAPNTGNTPASTLPPVGSGYLESDSSEVIFIQWNDNNGNLTGTAQEVFVNGSPPNLKTTSNTLPVTGTLNGSNISLRFELGPLEFGILSSGSFTMDFPQSDGSLAPVTFTSAPASTYNQALSQLQSEISSANQQAADAQALEQERNAIDHDAAVVQNYVAGLPQLEASLGTDVQGVQKGLQGVGADLAATHQAEEHVAGEAGGQEGQVCGDAAGVGGDAAGVSGDAAGVSGDAASVEADIAGSYDGLRPEIAAVNSAFSQFQSDESNLPGYQPPNPPTQSEVSQAVAAANAAISQALSTTNGYIDQANGDVTTAFQYVAQAYQAGNCGSPPSAPSPEQHIT